MEVYCMGQDKVNEKANSMLSAAKKSNINKSGLISFDKETFIRQYKAFFNNVPTRSYYGIIDEYKKTLTSDKYDIFCDKIDSISEDYYTVIIKKGAERFFDYMHDVLCGSVESVFDYDFEVWIYQDYDRVCQIVGSARNYKWTTQKDIRSNNRPHKNKSSWFEKENARIFGDTKV